MIYKCPICGYESHEAGMCPICNVPLEELAQKTEGEASVETKEEDGHKAPPAPGTYQT